MVSNLSQHSKCIIVGAGMAGLTAARQLNRAGVEVCILEKSRGTGGRMATRRLTLPDGREARFDHGAQSIMAERPRFRAIVDEWVAGGAAKLWIDGSDSAPIGMRDGRLRYRGVGGMTSISRALAHGLGIEVNTRVTAVSPGSRGWHVDTTAGRVYEADALILTAPVPQSLAVLEAGGTALPSDVQDSLSRITYTPCICVLAAYDAPTALRPPGIISSGADTTIQTVVDNHAKGVSPQAHAVTIHTSAEFSRDHWAANDEEIMSAVLSEVRDVLPEFPGHVMTHRWKYSRCLSPAPVPTVCLPGPNPIAFAGDAFGGQDIEGAFLSGMAAADRIATILGA